MCFYHVLLCFCHVLPCFYHVLLCFCHVLLCFAMFCCVFLSFAIFYCVLVVKISLFLRFKFGFIVDNIFSVLIPLFYAIKLIISLDSSIVKFKPFKSIDYIYIRQRQNAQKNDLELIKIGYILVVKICLFLHIRIFSGFSDVKIWLFLHIRFFSGFFLDVK